MIIHKIQLHTYFRLFAYVYMKALLIIAVVVSMIHMVLLFLSMFLRHIFYEKILLIEKTWCHQIASRSFSFAGMQMPLCVRCCGIMIGLSLAFFIKTKIPKERLFYLIICMISFSDIVLKRFGIDSSNLWRFFAGISLSLLFIVFIGFITESLKPNNNLNSASLLLNDSSMDKEMILCC